MSKYLLCLFPVFAFAGSILAASYPLPDSAGVWVKSGEQLVYTGDELYRMIDGGADIFFEYGFRQSIVQQYSFGNNFVDVEVYEMFDSAAASGIFSLISLETGIRTDFLSEAVEGEDFLIFRKGRFYVSLSASGAGTEKKSGIKLIAEEIAARIVFEGYPVLFYKYKTAFPEAKLTYIKGRLAVANLHFPAPVTMMLKEGIFIKEEENSAFVFFFGNKPDADGEFVKLLSGIKKDKKFTQVLSKENLFSFNDTEEKMLYCLLKNNSIIVIQYQNGKTSDETLKRILAAAEL